ncbi:MAG: VPEID-CTERM sorting domain-containing protein [Pseudomonadota bacterium]
MRILLSLIAVVVIVPTMALAGTVGSPPVDVPEIDAMAGLGALAAIGGIGALVWERRRNRDE